MTGNKSEKWTDKIGRAMNSAICFCIAYALLIGGFYLSMALMGKLFRINSTAYYYGVKFQMNHQTWTKLNVAFVYTIGIIFVTAFGLICATLFHKLKDKLYVFNLIFLWGMLISASVLSAQGLILCLGADDHNSPFYQNLAVLIVWFGLPAIVGYILSIPFFFFGIICAFLLTKPFLSLSYSFSKVNKTKRKQKYYLETVIVPFLVGGLIMIGLTFPLNMSINLTYIGFIALCITIGFFTLRFQEIKTDEILRYKDLQKGNLTIFIILLFLLGLVTLTWKGIYLG